MRRAKGCRAGALLNGLSLDRELPVPDHQPRQAAGLELALEDHAGQGVHHHLLDESLEGTRAVEGVEARGTRSTRPSEAPAEWEDAPVARPFAG